MTHMKPPEIFRPCPATILLQWEAVISEETEIAIQASEQIISTYFSEEIHEMTPTYTELALYVKKELKTSEFEARFIEMFTQQAAHVAIINPVIINIPVCYDTEFAPDLSRVAKYHGISEEKVIQLHSQTIYTISFIGFLPGFPYVRGLSEKLYTPRIDTPRTHIAKGSVGIGGKQTGIYPSDSPGGWNIIGRSPLAFFSAKKQQPSLLKAGDRVQFEPISKDEFDLIALEVATGIYQLKTQGDD
jgi:inhibitor of KinA